MKRFPLLIILPISIIIVITLGVILPSSQAKPFLPDTYISSIFVSLHNDQLFKPRSQEAVLTLGSEKGEDPEKTPVPTPEASAAPQATPEPSAPLETPAPPPKTGPEFTKVDKSYFDDALFIGDSRMVGMEEYSGLDNAAFFAIEGLTVYYLFDNAISMDGHSKPVTLDVALKQKQYGKIYIMVGINELGTGTLQYFKNTYQAAVQRIQKLQPNAIIFIQGILYVTDVRSESDNIINNKNIKERNNSLKELADGKSIYYIDVNEVMSDSNGNLNKEYTWDSCHLLGRYFSIWTDFLMQHGILTDKNKS